MARPGQLPQASTFCAPIFGTLIFRAPTFTASAFNTRLYRARWKPGCWVPLRLLPALLILTCLCSTQALAQHLLPQDQLGYLFTTPEQRAELDHRRRNPGPEATPGPPQPVLNAPGNQLTVKGLLIREDGHHITWVNNTHNMHSPIHENGLSVTVSAPDSNSPQVVIVKKHHQIPIRPGQTFKVEDNEIVENYQLVQPFPRQPFPRQKQNGQDTPGQINKAVRPTGALRKPEGMGPVAGIEAIGSLMDTAQQLNTEKRHRQIEEILSQDR